jgi:hypothetical protein
MVYALSEKLTSHLLLQSRTSGARCRRKGIALPSSARLPSQFV